MVKRFSFLLVALCLVIGTGVLIGCGGDLDEGVIEGTWVSVYNEVYTITPLRFTSAWDGSIAYAGTRVNHREDGSRAGYITIQYTTIQDNDEHSHVGRYYVIHYKNLTSTSVEIAGAGSETDPDFADWAPGGKTIQAEAEAEYTVQGGYFTFYSLCERQ